MRVRAALFEAPGVPLVVREIDLEGPGPGDALVRIDAVGICGSDLHVVKGEWVRPRPMVLGHEGAGVVEAVGADVEGLEPGDRVILSWAPACGECGPCLAGRPTACLPLRATPTRTPPRIPMRSARPSRTRRSATSTAWCGRP